MNNDWEATGFAHILVIRQMFNLRYISALYLVDVFCSGLKDTLCEINVNEDALQEMKDQVPLGLSRISYEDARSMILGAIDYARQLGIEPGPEGASVWESTSKYVIEFARTYDTKFTFGKDGLPYYVEGPEENNLEIIEKLSSLVRQGKATIAPMPEPVEVEVAGSDAVDESKYQVLKADRDEAKAEATDEDVKVEAGDADHVESEHRVGQDDEGDDDDIEDDDNEGDDSEGDDSFDDRCEFITEDLEEGYYEDALEASEELIEDFPKEAMPYFYMGTTLAMMGQSEAGIPYFDRAIEIEPAGEFYHNLGRAYMQVGQSAEALEAWEKTIELEGTDSPLGQEAQKEIDSLRNK
jgi:tetratricopeptide (TPR) repeat protein